VGRSETRAAMSLGPVRAEEAEGCPQPLRRPDSLRRQRPQWAAMYPLVAGRSLILGQRRNGLTYVPRETFHKPGYGADSRYPERRASTTHVLTSSQQGASANNLDWSDLSPPTEPVTTEKGQAGLLPAGPMCPLFRQNGSISSSSVKPSFF
jgi:hypothetical protein